MNKRTLGKSGLDVTELSLGGLFVSKFAAAREEGVAATRAAIEAGINYIDTAPSYGGGDSEVVLGEALKGFAPADNVILSTKLGGKPDPFDAKDVKHLQFSFDESRKLLGRDVIDILMIHEPDRPRQYAWWTDPQAVEGPVMEFVQDLKAKGQIKAIGIGGTTTTELAHLIRSDKFDVVLTAFNYSLTFRDALHEVIPDAVEHNLGIVVGSPLQQGVFAKRHDEQVQSWPWWMAKPRREQFLRLYKLSDDCGIDLPEMSLRYVLSNPDIHTTLTGSRSVAEVQANIASALKGPLPDDVLAELKAIGDLLPRRPCEEPFGLPMGRGYDGPGRAGR